MPKNFFVHTKYTKPLVESYETLSSVSTAGVVSIYAERAVKEKSAFVL